MLASHTMPDVLTPVFFLLIKWSVIPLVVSACLGAGLGFQSFRWKRIGGAVWGIVVGLIVVAPFSILAAGWGMRSGLPGAVSGGVLGTLIACWIAYLVARCGRPKPVLPVQIVPPED